MTTNAYIFSWDCYGIESIVPITQYENWELDDLVNVLKGQSKRPNPLNHIVGSLKLRAQCNPQRHYEIYAADCDPSLDEQFWKKQWEKAPQFCAELIREHGIKIYSDRRVENKIKIR